METESTDVSNEVRTYVKRLSIENNRLDDSVDGLFKITAEIERYQMGESGEPIPIVEPDGPIVLTLGAGAASPRLIDRLSKAALEIVRLAFGDYR